MVQRVQKSSRDGIVKVKLTFCTAAPLQTRVTLLAAGRGCCSCPSLTLPPPTPTSCLSRPRWELSPEEERQAPPEEELFLCLPPSPLSTSVREGGFRSAAADQQASAGRSRGRRLSELCSLSSLLARRRTAHLSGQQVAVAGCQRAGGRLARTIALLLPAGGGGCYNIHIPPRHRHSSYCDL